ncbi:hypothetical protein [Nonomuraea sp. NPDC003804]|uniref:hypothetical protein n=1 Tax=Nonomuraea sp. NPDC003804 TaxID=3154547 RepID=UPI0033B1A4F4
MDLDTDDVTSPPAVERSRRGLLGRAVGWVQRDHLRRGPLALMAGAYGLAEAAHQVDAPALVGLPLTAVAAIGMYAREMSLPGQRGPARAALATLAGGSWMTAAATWGVTASVEGIPGAMTWLGAVTAGLIYWAYRKDPAIVAAIAWQQAREDWHRRAPLYGLAGSHLVSWRETRLGEQFELDTVGTGRRASALASRDLEERIAEREMLKTSRVKARPGGIAGRLLISIRYKDPWAQPLPHPLLDPTPEIVLPQLADVREPFIIGMDPETGRPLQIVLWDEDGAKRIVIVALPGSGKTVILNCVYERASAADNAWPIGINVSKAKELRRWRRALGASACGPNERIKALRLLQFARHVIDYRGSLDDAEEATIEPTREVPLVPIILDEMDELLAKNDPIGLATRAEFAYVMSKGRSEGVPVIMAGTRGTAAYTGGGNSRTMVDQVVLGRVNRKSEMQHAAGEYGLSLPNMAEYGEGHAGVVLVADIGGQWSSGRGWKLDKLTDIDHLAARRRPAELEPGLMAYIVEQMGADVVTELLSIEPPTSRLAKAPKPAQRSAAPTPLESSMPEDVAAGRAAEARDRARTTLAQTGSLDTSLTAGERRAVAIERRRQAAEQTVIDPELRTVILRMVARPEGASTRDIERAMEQELGHERGLSKSGAWRCLDRLRFEGIVELRGKGRGASWHLIAPTPAAALTTDGASTLTTEELIEQAEEQAEDDAIDTANEHEE